MSHKKTERLTIGFTYEEYQRIGREAAGLRLSMSEYCRRVLLAHLEDELQESKDEEQEAVDGNKLLR